MAFPSAWGSPPMSGQTLPRCWVLLVRDVCWGPVGAQCPLSDVFLPGPPGSPCSFMSMCVHCLVCTMSPEEDSFIISTYNLNSYF